MTYFYNSSTGGFANESPPALQYFTYETQLHLGQGWHAYGTIQAMEAAIKANGWPPPDASKGLLSGTSTVPSTGTRAANALKNGVASAAKDAASSVFGAATQPAMWVRVGEVILGLALIIVGLAKLAEGTPIGNAAAKAAKVAMLT